MSVFLSVLGIDSHSGNLIQYIEKPWEADGVEGVLSWIPGWNMPISRLIPADSSKWMRNAVTSGSTIHRI